jgi:hypothetical protein
MKSSFLKLTIALVICAVILTGYGVWYAVVSIKSASVADLENQITAAIETAGRMASVRTALSKIIGDETIVQSYFVPEASVVAFINSLEARGHSQGATVSVLSVSAGSELVQPTLVLTLTIKGTFDAVMRTIGTIEYAPFAISISSLSLGQDFKNEWHANVKMYVGSIPLNARINPVGSDNLKTTTP